MSPRGIWGQMVIGGALFLVVCLLVWLGRLVAGVFK